MITVQKLSKIYEGRIPTHALKDATFTVNEGEFVAIMGRSGCGKSTLLHQLGLLDTPSGGEIIIDDTHVLALSERDKAKFRLEKLGYVFQEYALLPELTALESVYLPLMLLGRERAFFIKRAKEVLEQVGLGDRLDHLPKEMSGGEQQRVAIARALINNPKVLFADEPCANLDSESSVTVLELFKRLNKEFQQTVVMVTHEPEDERYVDRVIRMKDGVIIEA